MKIDIEIVTGFLGSGKTSFINSLLSESQVEGEKVLIFQLECGTSRITHSSDVNYPIKLVPINEVSELNEAMIYSIRKYNPNRIIIEYNGTANLKELIDILNKKVYKKCSKISTIFFVTNGKKIKQHVENIGNLIVPFIKSSNMIVVNNIENCNKDILEAGVKRLKQLNPKAYILKVNNKYVLKSALRETKVLDNGYFKKLKVKLENYKR
ncbi:GTP-binding protein [Clostridium saccharobutylicum]|uniref:Putative GTPase, G3E family n=1 Tax=Clostridium saccharobutylicum DSM 13864 TaxID=1345695 RepID=U5MSU4_CLOSA|nr:GTP-binding protein [Clostridium saccharobutylicum]AGX42736.1 putative GTPase, G3E family [Clostridium saccharobutylicum DSM 13864]AQR90032.1 CobW/HypB/UreG, nucleotide-binding domain [Clostridium saccharobutylicum]AQS09721.1 CobW/HypB/UreG, nucleotide-binding domain [Clostridium saccharobutylicum]MBA2904672.1 G3E family GTPase [Clostridium saccharobutylicum]MBA8789250.1 G3E family GTPase [Clostridium saccharobutylicum]